MPPILPSLSRPLGKPTRAILNAWSTRPVPTSKLFAPPRPTFKRADRGLYGSQCVRYGNNVPKARYARQKTRRRWLPNVRKKWFFSRALKQRIRLRVTAKVLRTMDKYGGLDGYLTRDKASHRKKLGLKGTELRHLVLCRGAIETEAREREEAARAQNPQALATESQLAAFRAQQQELQRREARVYADIAKKMARLGINSMDKLPPKGKYPKPTLF